ncbi:oligopeptidase A [Pseudomonas sp. PAGU 2196]|uniref:M3 family metallopeptidase n=1 Tax=Pseudomonas sp. PAGU 2196 TaxID=2793997 RepID=UPI001EDF8807|nr:M3 family metallopeptidase [Pseudomonas sp. PAGU 2196]GHS79529.1 oligopeptidase A [Pseudomonas sp. PAGU 2196]
MDNPLLQGGNIPVDYPSITREHILEAVEHVILAHEQGIARIIEHQQARPTWDDLVLAVDELDAQLWAVCYAVYPLMGKKGWDKAIFDCHGKVSARNVQRFGDSRLQPLYARLASSVDGVSLDASKRATLRWHLDMFVTAGAALAATDKARLVELEAQIAAACRSFADNITWPGLLITSEAELDGLPQTLRDQLAARADKAGVQGWMIGHDKAIIEAVLQHAHDRSLRKDLYHEIHTIGVSEDVAQDNATHLLRLVELRDERARLLGLANHSELTLLEKSAGSVIQVRVFLQCLAEAVAPAMLQWRSHLEQQAAAQGMGAVRPWDVSYLNSKPQARLPSEGFSQHFPLSAVVAALSDLAQHLFALDLRLTQLPTWHGSVQAFEVWQDHALVGYFYLDAVQHEGKYGASVATDPLRTRRINAEGIFQPAVVVVYSDIPAALAGAEPLLDHLSLRKLYHEFGLALYQLLVRTPTHFMSMVTPLGTDGIALIGRLFERWVWNAPYLTSIAAPRADGSELSRAQAEAFLRQFKQKGIETIGLDLSMALFDLDLHSAPRDGTSLARRLAEARELCGYWPLEDFERPAHAFDRWVKGDDAGFYAYLWADVHAFDLFTRFEAHGLLDRETGRALQETLFEPGASQPLRDGIEAFLGRLPSHAAYARWYGLT